MWEIDKHSADEIADRLYRLMSELCLARDTHQAYIERPRWGVIESNRRHGYALVIPGELRAS